MKLIYPSRPSWNQVEKGFKEIHTSNNLVTGEWTKKVEDKIKQIHGCKYCVLLSSATVGFMTLLKAVEKHYTIKDILMQDFTWESTKDIVSWMYPLVHKEYCDVDMIEWIAEEPDLKSDSLFIPNMTFGNTKTFKHKFTIYDSAHCLGNPVCNGRGLGEILSFSPAKVITGCEGGCVITNNRKIYKEVLNLRAKHGRLSELNACYLYYNLQNLTLELSRKSMIDDYYLMNLNQQYFSWTYGCPYFENIPNEIVYINATMNEKKRKKLRKTFDIRMRYKPTSSTSINSQYIYDHQIVLPQVSGKQQKEVIKVLNEICN